jgi:hypothetical protein
LAGLALSFIRHGNELASSRAFRHLSGFKPRLSLQPSNNARKISENEMKNKNFPPDFFIHLNECEALNENGKMFLRLLKLTQMLAVRLRIGFSY